MERQIPLVDIKGTAFYVDVQHEELRQKDNAANRISFNVFDLDGNGYTFLYDKKNRCAAEDKERITELGDQYEWVSLPALMELDPEGIALKYDIPLEILRPDALLKSEDDDEEEDDLEQHRSGF